MPKTPTTVQDSKGRSVYEDGPEQLSGTLDKRKSPNILRLAESVLLSLKCEQIMPFTPIPTSFVVWNFGSCLQRIPM